MTKFYAVIYTEHGDTCDGFARVLGTYKTKDKAKEELERDLFTYDYQGKYDRDDVSDSQVILGNDQDGCQWQILELEV